MPHVFFESVRSQYIWLFLGELAFAAICWCALEFVFLYVSVRVDVSLREMILLHALVVVLMSRKGSR